MYSQTLRSRNYVEEQICVRRSHENMERSHSSPQRQFGIISNSANSLRHLQCLSLCMRHSLWYHFFATILASGRAVVGPKHKHGGLGERGQHGGVLLFSLSSLWRPAVVPPADPSTIPSDASAFCVQGCHVQHRFARLRVPLFVSVCCKLYQSQPSMLTCQRSPCDVLTVNQTAVHIRTGRVFGGVVVRTIPDPSCWIHCV